MRKDFSEDLNMSLSEAKSAFFDQRGLPPMLLGMFISYDSSDENTHIVQGIKESFMEIDKYE